ncbi:MAG: glycosyltransferase [Hyphomicrobium sp.]
MRIAIQTLGTRGDVQPYIALALGLLKQGHTVQLAAPVQFEAMVQEHRIPFAPLPGEFLALLDTPDGKAAIAGGEGFSAGFKLLRHVRPLMRLLMDEEWAAVRGFAPDVIVHHPKSISSPHMAEALSCPAILASPFPGFTPTLAFPSPLLPFASLGPFNRASHVMVARGANFLFGKLIREWRQTTLGFAEYTRGADSRADTLYAYSRHVLPIPDDWGRDVLVSGYWFLDSGHWQPPSDLSAFLASGEPPVYIGFGSMPGLEPQKLTTIAIEALVKTGKRGVLATGGGALEILDAPANVHLISSAPHDWLFPRVTAIIHHGGAGTTGASLRAGKPTAICPFFGDQPFWGRRVAELGVGPPPLNRKSMSADALAAAVKAMDDSELRKRAAHVGAALEQEDGVASAVNFIERTVHTYLSGRRNGCRIRNGLDSAG